jgi:hypothetical protein
MQAFGYCYLFFARSQLSGKLQIASIGHYVYTDVYVVICVEIGGGIIGSDYT